MDIDLEEPLKYISKPYVLRELLNTQSAQIATLKTTTASTKTKAKSDSQGNIISNCWLTVF